MNTIKRLIKIVVITFIVIFVVIFLFAFFTQGTSHTGQSTPVNTPLPVVTDTPSAPSVTAGVHVCTPHDYSSQYLMCTVDSPTIADLTTARLSFNGASTFSSTSLTIIISHDTNGNSQFTEDGRYTGNDLSLSNSVESMSLWSAFSASSVSPVKGTHYQIEVDEGDPGNQSTFGQTTFTYTGA